MPVKLHRDVTATSRCKIVPADVSDVEQPSHGAGRSASNAFGFAYSLSVPRHGSHPSAQSRSREVRARRDPDQQPRVQPGRRGHRRRRISSATRTGASSRRWSALTDRSEPVDLVTLKDELTRSRASSTRSAGPRTSARSPTACRGRPTSSTTRKIVKEKSTLRRLIQSATDVLVARVRRRGGRRRPARRGRAVDLPDRRAPPAVGLRAASASWSTPATS